VRSTVSTAGWRRAHSPVGAEETIRRLAPQQEWDRWRVYAARRLDLSPTTFGVPE